MADKMAATYQFTSTGCCGHSNLLFLIRFLSNFIYSLLPSNPGSSSNMSFVRQTITKMANKMAAAYQFASIRCCGHSNLVIFNRTSSKFHMFFASIKPWFKFKYEFCRQTIIKMADKMAVAYQLVSVHCCGHSNLVIFIQISSNLHIWIASITLWFKFEYEFCPTNDSQDGRQMDTLPKSFIT